tara:strand:- start:4275 stop:5021 length:747 start_codon:yes stop_codon:yes gene_type:complete
MKEQQQFPAEEVTLPSKGLLYPKDSPLSSGIIEVKYMTAKEEDILTNANLIENGTVIDKLLQSLIISPINYNDLLTGDKNAILIAARILGYGKDYSFDYKGEKITVDLTTIKDKELDKSIVKGGKNEFNFTLPVSKKELTFKFLTHADELAIEKEIKGLKKLDKEAENTLTTRLKYIILAIDGVREKADIRKFVDENFLAIDARAFRNHIEEIQPSVDLSFDHEDHRGRINTINIPIGINFFWPDVTI